MPKYSVLITKTAQKQFDKLSDEVADSLLEALIELANDPRPNGCKKLKGRDGYRIRKGNYRIIYDVFDDILVIEVLALGHRKDIYN